MLFYSYPAVHGNVLMCRWPCEWLCAWDGEHYTRCIVKTPRQWCLRWHCVSTRAAPATCSGRGSCYLPPPDGWAVNDRPPPLTSAAMATNWPASPCPCHDLPSADADEERYWWRWRGNNCPRTRRSVFAARNVVQASSVLMRCIVQPESNEELTKAVTSHFTRVYPLNIFLNNNLSISLWLIYSRLDHVDSTVYLPWDGKISTSQRAVMLCGWGIKAGMACLLYLSALQNAIGI